MADNSEIMSILNKLIAQYEAGTYGKGEEALLDIAKKKSLASTSQSLVSSGLANTTMGAGAGQKWEEQVGMPSRLNLERQRKTGLSAALAAKAGYLQQTESEDRRYAAEKERTDAYTKAQNFSNLTRYAASRGRGGSTFDEDFPDKPTMDTAYGGRNYGSQDGGGSGRSTHPRSDSGGAGEGYWQTGPRAGGFNDATGRYTPMWVKGKPPKGYQLPANFIAPGRTQQSGGFNIPALNYKVPTKMEMLSSVGRKYMNQPLY